MMSEAVKESSMRKLMEEGHQIPDLAVELNRILIPLACQNFEKTGIQVAKFIAREYGAEVTLLHNGAGNLDKWAIPFEDLNISVNKIHKKESHDKTAEIILEESKNDYQLMIMPSRRRQRWIDKFLINSISAKIIDEVPYDVLQVFPANTELARAEEKIPEFNNVGILLSRTQRDPRLLIWAHSLLQKENSFLTAYHIADVPRMTPKRIALETSVVVKEHNDFDTLVAAYEELLSTKIVPKFIISHKVSPTAAAVLNKDMPDIAVMGQTKPHPWWQIRTLSDKILDKAKTAFIVHHHPI